MDTLDKKEQIWWTSFIIIPAIFFSATAEYFSDDSFTQILLAGLLSGIGAGIGGLVYYTFKKRSKVVKIVSLICLTVILFILLIGVVKWSQLDYLTCEVCGYKAFNEKEQECEVCGIADWKIEKLDSTYNSKQEWIREEQLFWFGTEDSLDFYLPLYKDNFEKDKEWRPQITRDALAADTL